MTVLYERVRAPQVVFLSDESSSTLDVGAQKFVLTRTTPRAMAAVGRMIGLVNHLKHLAQPHVTIAQRQISFRERKLIVALQTMDQIAPLRTLLSEKDRNERKQGMSLARAWIRAFLQVVQEGERARAA